MHIISYADLFFEFRIEFKHLIVRSALSLDKFKAHLMEGNIGKYFSYFLVCLAWVGIIFFDVTEYF